MMSVRGKTVLVTGGAVRVGKALTTAFSQAGQRVLIHCRESVREAEELCRAVGGEQAGNHVVRGDLSDPRSIDAFWDSLPVPPDILVNNASVFQRCPLAEESSERGLEQMNVNFWSPVELMKRMYRDCGETEDPCVINILDAAVVRSAADSFSYSVSKKALAEATKTAALQFAPRLRVNGICPGPVLPPKGMEQTGMKKILARIPLGRPAALDDICGVALLLAENRSMTGSLVFVDCGYSLM